MAFLTKEQHHAVAVLQVQHGAADRLMLEKTSEPTGLVWLRWHLAADALGLFKDRNFFIEPDGERLAWVSEQ